MSSTGKTSHVSNIRDAGLSALVALGIFGPMVGLLTINQGQSLTIVARPIAVAVIVLAVFLGRMLFLLVQPSVARRFATKSATRRNHLGNGSVGKAALSGLLIASLVLPFIPGIKTYQLDTAVLILTYVMLGWGLNIVVGLAGLLDLGYVAFYAVGAYSFAILAQTFGLGFWICLPIAGILAAVWGLILGFPVLRLRGDYLAIVTLAFGEIIRVVLINWTELTNGPNGITGIPRPTFFGLKFDMTGDPSSFAGFFGIEPATSHRLIFLYYVILALALLTNWVTLRARRLPLGRAWEAMREDEIAANSLGINTTTTKLTAFAMGAMFGGFAGAFFATRQGFISPESFTFGESALILAIVVLGGAGSQLGVVVASIVMVGGFELFRELSDYRLLVFGLALVILMIFKPRGFVSGRKPSVALGARKIIDGTFTAEGRG